MAFLREILGLFWPKRFQGKRVFWACVRIAFIVSACVLLWRAYGREDIACEVNAYNVTTLDSLPGQVCIIVGVNVGNSGPPTIAKNWTVNLTFKSGQRLECAMMMLPVVMQIEDSRGKWLKYYAEDALYNKTYPVPIPSGGEESGFLLCAVPERFTGQVTTKGTVATISFADIRGNIHSCKHTFSGIAAKAVHYAPGTKPPM